jgi:hypothetical protein
MPSANSEVYARRRHFKPLALCQLKDRHSEFWMLKHGDGANRRPAVVCLLRETTPMGFQDDPFRGHRRRWWLRRARPMEIEAYSVLIRLELVVSSLFLEGCAGCQQVKVPAFVPN